MKPRLSKRLPADHDGNQGKDVTALNCVPCAGAWGQPTSGPRGALEPWGGSSWEVMEGDLVPALLGLPGGSRRSAVMLGGLGAHLRVGSASLSCGDKLALLVLLGAERGWGLAALWEGLEMVPGWDSPAMCSDAFVPSWCWCWHSWQHIWRQTEAGRRRGGQQLQKPRVGLSELCCRFRLGLFWQHQGFFEVSPSLSVAVSFVQAGDAPGALCVTVWCSTT